VNVAPDYPSYSCIFGIHLRHGGHHHHRLPSEFRIHICPTTTLRRVTSRTRIVSVFEPNRAPIQSEDHQRKACD
jgi:hypothetical protein